jgi:hypothetical protein
MRGGTTGNVSGILPLILTRTLRKVILGSIIILITGGFIFFTSLHGNTQAKQHQDPS